jgi:hypothetical protein
MAFICIDVICLRFGIGFGFPGWQESWKQADFHSLFKPASVSSLGNIVIPALAFGFELLLQLDKVPAYSYANNQTATCKLNFC